MEKMAKRLAKMMVRERIIDDSMLEIYQYGLLRLFEMGAAVLTSSVICVSMGMLKEGLIFFAFFIPLRSYLGGIHLKKYWQCYIVSCLTLVLVLAITKFIALNIYVSCGLIVAASAGIGLEAKLEWREPEHRAYALVVWAVLMILLTVTAVCYVRGEQSVPVLLCCVTVIVLFSKVLGQISH